MIFLRVGKVQKTPICIYLRSKYHSSTYIAYKRIFNFVEIKFIVAKRQSFTLLDNPFPTKDFQKRIAQKCKWLSFRDNVFYFDKYIYSQWMPKVLLIRFDDFEC